METKNKNRKKKIKNHPPPPSPKKNSTKEFKEKPSCYTKPHGEVEDLFSEIRISRMFFEYDWK